MLSKIAKNTDEFIAGFSGEVQASLIKMRSIIKKAAPATEEAISYGIPTFKHNGKNLVHFSGYKSHIGFYPGSRAIEDFADELSDYQTSKGTVQFPLGKPLPSALITSMVKYRLALEKEKQSAKAKKTPKRTSR